MNQEEQEVQTQDTGNMTAEEIRTAILQQESEAKNTESQQEDNNAKDQSGTGVETEENQEAEEDNVFDALFEENKPEENDNAKDEKKEEEDNLEDEDKKLIDRRVEEKLQPYKQQILAAEKEKINTSFDKYIEENPQFNKYKDNVKPYATKLYNSFVKEGIKLEDGSIIRIPEGKYNDFVTAFVLGKGMLKIGASMKSQSDNEAAQGSQSADSYRSEEVGGIPNVEGMSRQDFEKLTQDVKTGKFRA